MSVVLSLAILTTGLVPLVILRSRALGDVAPRRDVTRDALVALGRVHRERALVAPEPRAADADVVSLDAYRVQRSRAAHPAGRGRVARSTSA
jgi:hypothetical protein